MNITKIVLIYNLRLNTTALLIGGELKTVPFSPQIPVGTYNGMTKSLKMYDRIDNKKNI